MILLAVDPSVSCTGLAQFRDGVLLWCGILQAKTAAQACQLARQTACGADRAVVELPRVYPTSRQKGDPNDLIAIAAVAGAWASRACDVVFVYPHQWKGQLPKTVAEDRIRALLSAQELAVLKRNLAPIKKALRNNAIDAVGLGLYESGRRIVG